MREIIKNKVLVSVLITVFLTISVCTNVYVSEGKLKLQEKETILWVSVQPDDELMIEERISSEIPQVKMIYSSGEGFGARFDFPGFYITPTTTSSGDFIDVHWLDASISGEIGTPGLPVERRLFVVPHEAKVSLNIHEGFASTIDLDATSLPWRVMAVQPPIVKLPGAIEQAQFQWEESVYNRAPVPGDRILIEELGIIRGQRLFLMEVRPLTYDPIMKKLTFCPDIEVEVQFTRRDSIQSDLTPMPRLRNIVLNPGMIPMPATYGSGNYLIIVASEYESDIASFATAKEAQGFSVITHAVSPGTSKESIKSYIEGLYGGADSPDYILLVGDTNTIPNWVGGGDGSPATDLPYACMDGGGDWYPDIAIGRFSVRSPDDLQAIVDKTLYYENGSLVDPEYVQRAVFMASEDNWVVSEGTHNWVIENYMDPLEIVSDKLYCHTYDATTQEVRDSFNNGRFYGIYSGHGGTYSWADGPPFSQSDVEGLTNENMYSFVCSFACSTGAYTTTECFTETWIRVENKGAIAVYGSSVSSFWTEDDMLEKRLFDAIYGEDDDVPMEVGPVWIDALMRYLDQMGSGSTTRRYFEMYNLMGDPSLAFPGASNGPITIQFPDGLPDLFVPGEPIDITVRIYPGDEEYIPDTGMLHYRYDDGEFIIVPLSHISDDLYQATFPSSSCGDTPEFYFSAEGSISGVVYSPLDAPASVHTATVGYIVFADDFETDQGWTVEDINLTTGGWERGIPIGGGDRGDPINDYDGSGQCYITGNLAGNYDVDGGPTQLISPTIDLYGTTNPELSYARWFFNDDQDEDRLVIEISNDNGETWTLIESVADIGEEEGWVKVIVSILDYVDLTSQVKIRFSVKDDPNNSITEAAIDAVEVVVPVCQNVLTIDGEIFKSDGITPELDPEVTITNLDTGGTWAATVEEGGNFYSVQLLVGTEVSASDTLRITAKKTFEDGGEYNPAGYTYSVNVTDCEVTTADIDNYGIFGFNLNLDHYCINYYPDYPYFIKEQPEYSGAAVLQMWTDFKGVGPYSQDDLQSWGLSNNTEEDQTAGLPYIDPRGMAITLKWLVGDFLPTGYGFTVGVMPGDSSGLNWAMHRICWWQYLGPGALPTGGNYEHWMSVRGIHTDKQPQEGVYNGTGDWEYDVYGFWINDPDDSLGSIGANSYKTADEWTSTYYTTITDSYNPNWDGKYITVLEPPEFDAEVNIVPAKPRVLRSITPITIAKPIVIHHNEYTVHIETVEDVDALDVVEAAINGVTEELLPYDAGFAAAFEHTIAGEPLYVTDEYGDYYIVPFKVPVQGIQLQAIKSAMFERIGEDNIEIVSIVNEKIQVEKIPFKRVLEMRTLIVVLVNADDGSFKEASWVKEPVKYLPLSQADILEILPDILMKIGVKSGDTRDIQIDLVHRDSTPYYPDWKITLKDMVFFVGQDRTVS